MNLKDFEQQVNDLPNDKCINKATMIRDFEALFPDYDIEKWLLPLPPWARRGYEDFGEQAWEILKQDLISEPTGRPISIYIHLPFCSSKCHFCDSYSFQLKSHKKSIINKYIDHLCMEMELWAQLGDISDRHVTTVHLGGGTPTFIGSPELYRLSECLRACFKISFDTEWALESTVSDLTPDMLETMRSIGFKRLHLGVQSMEDKVRNIIGRRTNSNGVMNKIRTALAMEWVVTVDLIAGLPEETITGFIKGINTLIQLGIDGFSLYELLIYRQNQRWAEKMNLLEERHLTNYIFFQIGANIFEQSGYIKNVFNHWSNERDKNIYFTFPTRNEDLLALGAISDGVFGNYHYRHPTYPNYMKHVTSSFPGIEGGVRRNSKEEQLQPLITALLSANINPMLSKYIEANHFDTMERWKKAMLITEMPDGNLHLSNNGSWFAGNMISDLLPD